MSNSYVTVKSAPGESGILSNFNRLAAVARGALGRLSMSVTAICTFLQDPHVHLLRESKSPLQLRDYARRLHA